MTTCTIAFDTSGNGPAQVALRRSDGAIFESCGGDAQSHNEELALLVAQVLSKAGIAISEVSRCVVGAGPGSFTGLRIGYGFAKGLVQALGIPICSISTLQGMALEFLGEHPIVGAVIDARRKEVFLGMYQRGESGQISALLEPGIVPLEDLPRLCEQVAAKIGVGIGEVLLCGMRGLDLKLSLEEPRCLARSLIELSDDAQPLASVEELSELSPEYFRAVAALTIEERAAQKGTLGS